MHKYDIVIYYENSWHTIPTLRLKRAKINTNKEQILFYYYIKV